MEGQSAVTMPLSANRPLTMGAGVIQQPQTPDLNQRLLRIASQAQNSPGFTESLALETFTLLPELEQRARLDMKSYAQSIEADARIEMWHVEASEVPFFSKLTQYEAQNVEYALLSEQWSPDERDQFIAQGLLPYVIDKMRRFALTALGEKMGQETELRANARTPGQEVFAEAVNSLFRYFDRVNRWKMSKNYVYRDGMVGARGISGCMKDPMNPMGALKKVRYMPREFIWHTQTAYNARLKECKYFERIFYDYRASMMMEFPEYAEDIRAFQAGLWGNQAAHLIDLDALIKPKVQPTTGSSNGPYVHNPQAYMYWRDTILRREFFRKHKVLKYRVTDPYRSKEVDFDAQDQAQSFAASTYRYWKNTFLAYKVQIEPQIGLQAVYVDQIEKLTWAGNILLRVEPIGDSIPYNLFCPEMYDGQITSFFGHGKDPQRLVNRSATHYEQIAGAAKGKVIVNKWGMPVEFEDADIKENIASSTEPLIVNVPPGQSLDDVYRVVGPGPMGEAPKMVMQMASENANEMFGGENFIGQQETSAESGRAVLARQTAASLALIPYEEEFRAYEEQQGEQDLRILQSLDPAVIQSILRRESPDKANDLADAFLSMGVQSLDEIEMDLELVEVSASPSTKDRIASQISTVISQAPQTAQYWMPALIANLSIDPSISQPILQEMQQDKLQQQQMAQQLQSHQIDMETKKMDLQHLDKIIKIKELEIQANPPWQKAVSMKLGNDPAMVAEVSNQIGVEADPLGVAADQAMGAFIKQGALDMQQQHRNANLLPEEREALKAKASIYRNVPSTSDAGARATKTVEK